MFLLTSFSVAMATPRRPFQPLDEPATRRAPELVPCTYVEVVSPAFEPNRVILRRVLLLNYDKSKYVSVGFYTAQNYHRLVVFGGTTLLPLVFAADFVTVLVERLPGLLEAMCQNEQFQWRSEDTVFRVNSTGLYRVARFTLDKHWILFKLHELRNLLYIFYMITNQLIVYTEELGDVKCYGNAAMASDSYDEPAPTSSRFTFTASYSRSSNYLCNSIFSIKTVFAFDYSCVFYSHPRLC